MRSFSEQQPSQNTKDIPYNQLKDPLGHIYAFDNDDAQPEESLGESIHFTSKKNNYASRNTKSQGVTELRWS